MEKQWKDKKVFITGGTSGLGKALAEILHGFGAQVGIAARTEKNVHALADHLPNLCGMVADVSDKNAIYPLAAEVHSKLGGIDALFNVASYLGTSPLRHLMDTDCEDFQRVLETNVLGPFRLTKALLPQMLLQGHGHVVNISSDAAIHAYQGWGTYGASKAAIDHLTQIWAAELEGQGVSMVSIDPGDMATPMHYAAVPDADPKTLQNPKDAAQKLLLSLEDSEDKTVRRVA